MIRFDERDRERKRVTNDNPADLSVWNRARVLGVEGDKRKGLGGRLDEL